MIREKKQCTANYTSFSHWFPGQHSLIKYPVITQLRELEWIEKVRICKSNFSASVVISHWWSGVRSGKALTLILQMHVWWKLFVLICSQHEHRHLTEQKNGNIRMKRKKTSSRIGSFLIKLRRTYKPLSFGGINWKCSERYMYKI